MMLTNERLATGIRFGTMLLLGTALAATGLSRAVAQDSSAGESHPAHIHAGSCANLGDVIYPLTNVSDNGMMAGMMASPAAGAMGSPEAGMNMGQKMGSSAAVPVQTSYTLVNAPLDKIVNGNTAINVHESQAKIQNYIACGDIGGQVMTGPGMEQGGTLVIGLKELNSSGYSGVAVLEGKGNQTQVIVYLAEDLSGKAAAGGEYGTAQAGESSGEYGTAKAGESGEYGSPAAGASNQSSAKTVQATIQNYAYHPDPIEVAVGTTVTWTNDDSVPHTVTGTDQTVIKSPVINPGQSYSVTFDKAGSYDYHCEFHAGMKGTVVVK